MRRGIAVVVGLLLMPILAAAQQVEYYHLDALGSVRAVTDGSGAVLVRHDYEPYGVEWNEAESADSRRFTAKERDAESGLDYFGARYYSAPVARFTSVDPAYAWSENLADPERWNRYAYVRNNPLRYVDPDGRAIETPWDVLNLGIGVASFAANVSSGNVGGAVLDALGIVYDATATAVPILPGGAGTAIRTARAADRAVDLVRAGDKASDIARAADGATDAAKAADNAREGMGFTRSGKRQIDQANAEKYGGTNVCENCQVEVTPGRRHERGVTPPGNERQRDHVVPRSKGGSGIPDNGQVLCRTCNIQKSNQ